MTAVDCSDQPKEFMRNLLNLLKTNGQLVAETGLEKILGDASVYTPGLQTATVDVGGRTFFI